MATMYPPTIAEREAELAALQAAFDEYITSSRELEEELDAELAKMQEKLGESSAANAALSSQLENIVPQLGSLEKALAETRHKLEQEQSLRRQAEQGQDEAEARCREAEGAMMALKEDCDAAHEELAFKESELEETRLELEVEKERHRVDMEELRMDQEASRSIAATDSNDKAVISNGSPGKNTFGDEDGFLSGSVDDDTKMKEDTDYVKRLEDELELVTEQLIETEQRLTTAEDELENLKTSSTVKNDKAATLTGEQAAELTLLREQHHTNIEQLQNVKEELELAQEELLLTQEELKAAEADVGTYEEKLETVRVAHRDEVKNLTSALDEAKSSNRSSAMDLEMLEASLTKSAKEAEEQRTELENLQRAYDNSKKDHACALEELEQVYQRFDESKKEAERSGRDAAAEEVRASMSMAREAEVANLSKEIDALSSKNASLQQQVDELEMQLAEAHDSDKKVNDETSETVKRLQDQLERSKGETTKKQQDLDTLKKSVDERLTTAEENAVKLEKELSATKGKLYEAEARVIVTNTREKSGATVEATRAIVDSNGDSSEVDEAAQQKLAELQKKHDDLKEQNRIMETHQKRLETELKTLQKQLFAGDGDAPVVTQMSRLSQMASPGTGGGIMDNTPSSVEEIIDRNDQAAMIEELRNLEKKTMMQRDYNAKLLGKILSLQGNIQVCCRVRPLSTKEIQAGNKNVIEGLSETELGCFDGRNSKWKSFAFDRVWGPDQAQTDIFQDVEPLALSVVDGYNACIFAYGQTGSGKTYTMEGVSDNNGYGISYRTIQKLFTLLNLRSQQQKAAVAAGGDDKEFSFSLQLGMLEIYNDEIYDLLADHASAGSKADQKREAKKAGVKATLDIKRSAEGRVSVPDLTKEGVKSIEDVMNLLKRGNASRATAATNLNEHSSRSHMVLAVEVESGLVGEPSNKGTLYLVDLAGSERVRNSKVEGEHLKEATHINKSLSALGNVMEALDRKASHVPYRDSKLTYLLQDSLGGNSRTMMIVAVCPMDIAHDESVHALQFATRVRRIQLGTAQRNITSKNLEETVKSLTNEIKALSKAKEKTETQMSTLKRDNTRIQAKLQSMSSQRSSSQSDSKTLELLRKNNNDMAARWNKEKSMRERTGEDLEKTKTDLRKKQTELTKVSRDKDSLERKLEDKENQLSQALRDVRDAKDASSAANLRARKAQLIGSRHTTTRPTRTTPAVAKTTPSTTRATKSPPKVRSNGNSNGKDADLESIKKEVVALLTKYDEAKVDRIDIIMEKFKGKETLLVDKMKQRYEGGAVASSASQSLQKRSEMALQRHKDRMQKRLEQQQQQASK